MTFVQVNLLAIVGGVAGSVVALTQLTAVEQGYYFTFSSLLNARILFELGSSSALSHVFSRASRTWHDTDGELGPLVRFAFAWHALAAALILLFGVTLGVGVLSQEGLPNDEWQLAWLLSLVAQAVATLLAPAGPLVQAFALPIEYWRYRRAVQAGAALVFPVALFLGAGLYSVPIAGAVTVGLTLVLLYRPYGRTIASLLVRAKLPGRRRAIQLIVFQAKVAIGWIAGNYLFFALNIAIFGRLGATTAGRLGIVVAALTTITAIVSAFHLTQVPELARRAVFGSSALVESHRLLQRRSLMLAIPTVLVASLGLAAFRSLFPSFADRVPSLADAILLFVAAALLGLLNNYTILARSLESDPFLMAGVASAVGAVVVATRVAESLADVGVIAVAGQALVRAPWVHWRYRRLFPRAIGGLPA